MLLMCSLQLFFKHCNMYGNMIPVQGVGFITGQPIISWNVAHDLKSFTFTFPGFFSDQIQ